MNKKCSFNHKLHFFCITAHIATSRTMQTNSASRRSTSPRPASRSAVLELPIGSTATFAKTSASPPPKSEEGKSKGCTIIKSRILSHKGTIISANGSQEPACSDEEQTGSPTNRVIGLSRVRKGDRKIRKILDR